MRKFINTTGAKFTAVCTALAVPVLAHAEEADIGAKAVAEIDKLKPMVAAVGGAFLGVALAIVGYKVISRIVNRG